MKKVYGLCNIRKSHGKGNHLIIDGFSKDKGILSNKREIKKILFEIIKKIKMTPISKPFLVKYTSDKEDKTQDGITGIIILAESNITIHTYPHYDFFCLDIFSCNEFDIEEAVNYLIKRLHIKKYKKKILKRGFYDGKS